MDLYEHRESDTRLGRIARIYGGLLLLVAVVAGIVGAGRLVRPWILAAWRTFAAPLLDTIRQVIGT